MKLAPSLLSADFASLLAEAESVCPPASRLHWDVMDGHFVPNLTFGPPVVNALRRRLDVPFEIHLMIDHPAAYASQFEVVSGDTIIFHVEASDSAEESAAAIRRAGARVGISLRPGTPLERIRPYLDAVSLVLIMSVEPGFGGQSFLSDAVTRIRSLKQWIGARPIEIAVDGGINPRTAASVARAGADILVAGSAIFSAPDRHAAMRALEEAAE